jgi:hypothetical protein
MHKALLGAVVALAFSLGAGHAAHACGKGALLLEDGFDTLQPIWGEADEWMTVQDKRLVIKEQDGHFYSVSTSSTYQEVDYCATVSLLASPDLGYTYAGLIFWGKDAHNFYAFQITFDGYATVYRYADGKWVAVIKDRKAGAARTGLRAISRLRVVTNGDKATFYVNDAKFGTVTGDPPEGGQRIGFSVEAPSKGEAIFALDNVQVNEQVAGK